jgi:hypothetical protein
MKKFFCASIASVFIITFIYGIALGKDNATNNSAFKHDGYGRLIYNSSYTKIKCPKQTERVGVIVAFGQSNSANHAEFKVPMSELHGVINYFNGNCYAAQSPLLGATSIDGEWITLTAKKLIEAGIYEKIVVVSSGIGGTRIERWAHENDLNNMFMGVLSNLSKNYSVTDMIWHQGESDISYTHTEVYETYFKSMINSIRNTGIDAPIFISIASICGEAKRWEYPNRVSIAQSNLVEVDGIEFGVNTDVLVPIKLRYDKCHFSKIGQEIAASELAKSIAKFHLNE